MIKLKLITHTPNVEQVVASAARLCYSPVGVEEILEKITYEKACEFVENLANMGHESPLEHVSFTFAVEGISRACSHQIVRHRLASYSQQSQRYVRENNFEYIIPKDIEKSKIATDIFKETMVQSQKAYDAIVDELITIYAMEDGYFKFYTDYVKQYELGVVDVSEYLSLFGFLKKNFKCKFGEFEKKAIENARYVFPNATETKMVFTMNTRSLYNFLSVRCCTRAQEEIREVANGMLKELRQVAPVLFKNAGPKCLRGKCPEGSMSCGKNK